MRSTTRFFLTTVSNRYSRYSLAGANAGPYPPHSALCTSVQVVYGCVVADTIVQIRSNLAAVQDHSRQFSDFTFVYPVISRRSRGLSIGVNLNPDKVCNFDCVYCEVDRRIPGKVSQVDLNQLRDELIAMIRFARDWGVGKGPQINELPAYLTPHVH